MLALANTANEELFITTCAALVTGRLEHASGKFSNLYSDLENEKQVRCSSERLG